MSETNQNWLTQSGRIVNEEDRKEQIEELIVFYFTQLLDGIPVKEALSNPNKHIQMFVNSLGLEMSDAVEIMNDYYQKAFGENQTKTK